MTTARSSQLDTVLPTNSSPLDSKEPPTNPGRLSMERGIDPSKHESIVDFSIEGLTHDEQLIIASLPFSDSDHPSELYFRRQFARNLHKTLKYGSEDIAADEWEAIEFELQALRVEEALRKSLADFESTPIEYKRPAHNKLLKGMKLAQTTIDVLNTFRFRVTDFNRAFSFKKADFISETAKDKMGDAGLGLNIFDVVVELFGPLYKTFRAKKTNENSLENNKGESNSSLKRFSNHITKGNRPFRLLDATVSLVLTIISYAVAGIVLTVASPALMVAMTCIGVWQEVDRYSEALKKISKSIANANGHRKRIEDNLANIEQDIDLNKKSIAEYKQLLEILAKEEEIDYNRQRETQNEWKVPVAKIDYYVRERHSLHSKIAAIAAKNESYSVEVEKLVNKDNQYSARLQSLQSIKEKTEVKKKLVKTAGYKKIARIVLLTGGALLCTYLAPQIAIFIAWGLLIMGVGMLGQRLYSIHQNYRESVRKEADTTELVRRNTVANGKRLTPEPQRTSHAKLMVQLNGGVGQPPVPVVTRLRETQTNNPNASASHLSLASLDGGDERAPLLTNVVPSTGGDSSHSLASLATPSPSPLSRDENNPPGPGVRFT